MVCRGMKIRYFVNGMDWKKIIVVGIVCLGTSVSFGQVKDFDQLEMLYAQRHYKRVYRKSNQLLDKPEYDYSMMPRYYKSISLLQLIQNRYWLKTHPYAMEDARELFQEVKSAPDAEKLFNAHMYELSWLRSDMQTWVSDLKRMGLKDEFQAAQELYHAIFKGIQELAVPGEDNGTKEPVIVSPEMNSGVRGTIVSDAQKYLGTPYVWAGNTPEGFDCSGFTSYVMGLHGIEIPRRSSDQFEQSTRLKQKNVQAGDLVFFNNGSGISHVGIIISAQGQPLVMIHSSSSKGVIITEIEKSEYWMNRLHGFGTYLR